MHAHHTNYLKRPDNPAGRGHLVSVGFWVHDLPRLLILCRLFGHKPVVDGVGDPTAEHHRRGHVARWVCCDRCGARPDPQGNLDPATATIDRPYRGPHGGQQPDLSKTTRAYLESHPDEPVHYPPGPWGPMPTGTVGGQLVIGGGLGGIGFDVKVGNAGSEHTLAASLRFGWLGTLYLHTERIGTWLQRRLNPVGYDSREIGLDVGLTRIEWKLWAKRDHSSRDDPWWMAGRIRINLLDRLLGPKRYSYENVGDPVAATVRMPHGDDHPVTLKLQRRTLGRKRGRRRLAWCVDWNTAPGIPTRNTDRGRIQGSGVEIPDGIGRRDHDDPWHHDQWVPVACAAIATSMTELRARNGYQQPIPFPTETR